MKIIEQVEIKNFRSFGNRKGETTKVSKVNHLNIISGANDSGKSNILRGLNLFFNGFTELNVELSFKHEKKDVYNNFLQDDDSLKSMTKASLQKQLTDFLGAIQYHYIPAIKDRQYFSHLYGELQQTLWKAKKSVVDEKKNVFEKEIQKETTLLMDEFKETLNHPSLNFEPAFQLPQNMIDLFKTLQVKTGDVDLRFRGDGVQAKIIPEILYFIAVKEKSFTSMTVRQGEHSKKYFIWGFEEPENSYEYKNAQLLANRFKDKFLEHAQIFITTHSFNFISISSEDAAKYRVWKDKKTASSKISKLKETSSGQVTFEGMNGDEDVLLEELGFFHLNDEIMNAYESVEALKKDYIEKLETINRPVVYTEGNNTQFLEISKELFSNDLEYDIESLGGKNEIKKFFTMFSTANFSRFKIIFVFDCDAKNEYEYCKKLETEHLKPYIFSENPMNTLKETQRGIENMFDDSYFDNETTIFSITETKKDGAIMSRIRKLRKPEFATYMIDTHNNEEAFEKFEDIQNIISNTFE